MSNGFAPPGEQKIDVPLDGGLVNLPPAWLLRPGELVRADNCEYQPGDPSLHKSKLTAAFATNITPATAPYLAHQLFYATFETHDDILVIVQIFITATSGIGLRVYFASATQGASIFWMTPQPDLVMPTAPRRGTLLQVSDEAFLALGQDTTLYGRVSVDLGYPRIYPWGVKPTTLALDCTWMWLKPFTAREAADWADWDHIMVAEQNPGYGDPTRTQYRWVDPLQWMKTGPKSRDTAPGYVYQTDYGHFVPVTPNIYTDVLQPFDGEPEYVVWITEYNATDDLETGFVDDIVPLTYLPRIYKGYTTAAYEPTPTVLDPAINRTRPHHLKPPLKFFRGLPGFPPTTVPDADISYGGGLVLRLSIDLTNLKSTTTHIRVYMTARSGAWPDGGLVPPGDIYLAFKRTDPDVDLIYEDHEANPFTGEGKTLFFGCPAGEPGIPVNAWNVNIEFKSGITEFKVGDTTLNPRTTDNKMHLFVMRRYPNYPTRPTTAFPVVEVDVAGAVSSVTVRNQPPPLCTIGAVYRDMLVVADDASPGDIRWTPPNEHHYFPALYVKNIADKPTCIRTVGRLLFVGGRRSLHVARFLPTTGLVDELLEDAFSTVDVSHGPASSRSACSFQHPMFGPTLIFMDSLGGLWMSDGTSIRSALSRTDLRATGAAVTPEVCVLVDDSLLHRINVFANSSTLPEAALPECDRVFLLHYHPDHLNTDGTLKLTGPNTHQVKTRDAVDGRGSVFSLHTDIQVYRHEAQVNRNDLWRFRTGVINPRGLGRDFFVNRVRFLHGALASGTVPPLPGQLIQLITRLLFYRNGTQSFDSGGRYLPADIEAITTQDLTTGSEGFQIDCEGGASGRVSLVEADIDQSGVAPG